MSGEQLDAMRKLAVIVALAASCSAPIGNTSSTTAALTNLGSEPGPAQLVGCEPALLNCSGGGSGSAMTLALVGVAVAAVVAIVWFWRPGSDDTP